APSRQGPYITPNIVAPPLRVASAGPQPCATGGLEGYLHAEPETALTGKAAAGGEEVRIRGSRPRVGELRHRRERRAVVQQSPVSVAYRVWNSGAWFRLQVVALVENRDRLPVEHV